MIGIYKITSPKGRVYIGQSIDILYRFKKYKQMQCKGQVRLYNSFLKHNVENHLFEIIIECEINALNNLERQYQEKYNVLSKKGLNCQYVKSDCKKNVLSEETKLKISKGNKGKKRTKEFKNLMRKKMLNISDETRNKMSESAKKKTVTKEHREKARLGKIGCTQKRFNVLNTESGIFHESIPKAADTYGFTYTVLKSMLLGNSKNKTNLIYIK